METVDLSVYAPDVKCDRRCEKGASANQNENPNGNESEGVCGTGKGCGNVSGSPNARADDARQTQQW